MKLFADEEAIETRCPGGVLPVPDIAVKLFADEEAIETLAGFSVGAYCA